MRVKRGVGVVCDMREGSDGATGNFTGALNAGAAGGRGARRTGGGSSGASDEELREVWGAGR
eukprot:6002084-Amphidinium_carterae.1